MQLVAGFNEKPVELGIRLLGGMLDSPLQLVVVPLPLLSGGVPIVQSPRYVVAKGSVHNS